MLSEHFDRDEFRCRCGCGLNTVDAELLQVLQRLRNHFDSPVIVTSGHRCYEHNHAVMGAVKSLHLVGKAADIKVKGQPSNDVFTLLSRWYPEKYGVALYPSWVHVDVRPDRARWRG